MKLNNIFGRIAAIFMLCLTTTVGFSQVDPVIEVAGPVAPTHCTLQQVSVNYHPGGITQQETNMFDGSWIGLGNGKYRFTSHTDYYQDVNFLALGLGTGIMQADFWLNPWTGVFESIPGQSFIGGVPYDLSCITKFQLQTDGTYSVVICFIPNVFDIGFSFPIGCGDGPVSTKQGVVIGHQPFELIQTNPNNVFVEACPVGIDGKESVYTVGIKENSCIGVNFTSEVDLDYDPLVKTIKWYGISKNNCTGDEVKYYVAQTIIGATLTDEQLHVNVLDDECPTICIQTCDDPASPLSHYDVENPQLISGAGDTIQVWSFEFTSPSGVNHDGVYTFYVPDPSAVNCGDPCQQDLGCKPFTEVNGVCMRDLDAVFCDGEYNGTEHHAHEFQKMRDCSGNPGTVLPIFENGVYVGLKVDLDGKTYQGNFRHVSMFTGFHLGEVKVDSLTCEVTMVVCRYFICGQSLPEISFDSILDNGDGTSTGIVMLQDGCHEVIFDNCPSNNEPCDGVNIVASATITNDQCEDGIGAIIISEPIGGTAPYTYSWTWSGGSSTDQSQTGLTEGEYTLIVTDAISCTFTRTSTVSNSNIDCDACEGVELLLNYNQTLDSLSHCNPQPEIIDIIANIQSNIDATYTYLSNTTATSYILTIYGAGVECETYDTLEIAIPIAQVPTFSYMVGDITCNDTEVEVTISGPPASYVWQNGQSGQSNLVGVGNSWDVDITDEYGCEIDLLIVVPDAPTPDPVNLDIFTDCEFSTISIDVTDQIIDIYFDGDLVGQGSQVDVFESGDYNILVDQQNGCIAQVDTTITITPAPTVNIMTTDVLCAGSVGQAVLQISNDSGSFFEVYIDNTWVGNDMYIHEVDPGTYEFLIIFEGGCEVTELVTIQELILQMDPTIELENCELGENGSINANVSGGSGNYTYIWAHDTALTTGSIEVPTGVYQLTVIDNETGCILEQQFTVLCSNGCTVFWNNGCLQVYHQDGQLVVSTNVTVEVYNVSGSIVYTGTITTDADGNLLTTCIDLSSLPSGYYWIKIYDILAPGVYQIRPFYIPGWYITN